MRQAVTSAFSFVCIIALATAASAEVTWDRFTTEDGLLDKNVFSLFAAKDGSIWIGTGGRGLSQYVNGGFLTWDTGADWVPNVTFDICQDQTGRIWASSYYEGCVYLDEAGWQEGFSLPWETAPGRFEMWAKSGLELAPDGRIWAGFSGGIMWLDPISKERRTAWQTPPPSGSPVYWPDPGQILLDLNGDIWFRSGMDTLEIDQNGNTLRTFCGKDTSALAEGLDGTIYIATGYYTADFDVQKLESGEFVSVSPPPGAFPSKPWSPLEIGNQGALLAGSYGSESSGLFTFDGISWEYDESPYPSPGIPCPIDAIEEREDGEIWLGVITNGDKADGGIWVLHRGPGLPPILLGLATDKTEYHASDPMSVLLDFESEVERTVDFYVAVELPSGALCFYPSLGTSWAPFLSGLRVFPDTDLHDYSLFTETLSGLSAGTYRWYAVCTDAGTLDFGSNIGCCEWEFVK